MEVFYDIFDVPAPKAIESEKISNQKRKQTDHLEMTPKRKM